MAKYEMFRGAVFGGYNKADVHAYIQNMENEMEAVKMQCQQEVASLKRKLAAKTPEAPEDGDREELRKKAEDLEARLQAAEEELQSASAELGKMQDIYQEQQAALLEKEEQLSAQRQKLTEQEALLEQQEALLKQQENLLREKPEEPAPEVVPEPEKKAEMPRNEKIDTDSFLDKDTIQKVLEEAYDNARLIREEAEKEREKILAEAAREAEDRKKQIMSRAHMELEEKGIQLMAAKHKIDRYAKEIRHAQEGLYGIYSRMNRMVEHMPVRADNYWEEGELWLLEKEEHAGAADKAGKLPEKPDTEGPDSRTKA